MDMMCTSPVLPDILLLPTPHRIAMLYPQRSIVSFLHITRPFISILFFPSSMQFNVMSLNAGPESVFAVTYALALVGDDAVRADGVTLLPLGKKWTALALECVGVSSMGLRLSQEEEPSTEQVSQQ